MRERGPTSLPFFVGAEMHFKPYSDILDVNDPALISEIQAWVKNDRVSWVCQEKVKGAQFSIWIGQHFQACANRHRFLRENEDYFNWKAIRDSFVPSILDIRARAGFRDIVIYGELFGGYYPHLDVDEYGGAIPLKRKVAYSPHNDWYAFDVVVDGMWQPQWYIYQLFDELGVKYAFEVFRGKFDKALKRNHEFPSEVHELFGLPRIHGNTCAGVVIRPDSPIFLPDGRRVLLKREVSR
jgi:Rnl2 family RNA ligase